MPLLHDRTLGLLSDDLRETCHARTRSVWFQVHFHTPKVHYEVWLARKIERIEIGLHFEGPRDFSYRWAELIAGHMEEIYAGVGPDYELEEWTSSWTRFHETIPYDPLSESLAYELADRLARLIITCQPLIEKERVNVPPELEQVMKTAPTRSRGPFRRRRARPA